MFGFGSLSHLLLVLVIALIVIGPKQLPEVARTLGRLLNELKRASNMLSDEFHSQLKNEEHQNQIHHQAPSASVAVQEPKKSAPAVAPSAPNEEKKS